MAEQAPHPAVAAFHDNLKKHSTTRLARMAALRTARAAKYAADHNEPAPEVKDAASDS